MSDKVSVTPDLAAAEAARAWLDWRSWCPSHFQIRDKAGQVVPLNLWPGQLKLFEAAEEQQRQRQPVRLIYLKSRQVAVSVSVAAWIARYVFFLPGQTALVYAHEASAAMQLWQYYMQLAEGYRQSLDQDLSILAIEGATKGERIELAGGGFLDFRTADNTRSGRSKSYRFVHCSEYGFWRDPAELFAAIMSAVPEEPDTGVFVESTAYGQAGDFHARWQVAAESKVWKRVFCGWQEHPEYVLPLTEVQEAALQPTLTRNEHDLTINLGVRLDQIAWRRAKLDHLKGNEDLFRQEHPSTPEEAWLMQGRAYFDPASIRCHVIVREPLAGRLERIEVGTRSVLRFVPHPAGELLLYRKPIENHQYVIGADTAEGEDALNKLGTDPDWSVASVLDLESHEQVAVWRGRWQPAPFGQMLAELGKFYNNAYIVPELNSAGFGTLALLMQHYEQSRIYQRDRDRDWTAGGKAGRFGWRTTALNRPELLSYLDQALRERDLHLHDAQTITELYQFVTMPNGKPEAASGSHDDCVFALALAVVGIQQAPREMVLKAHGGVEERGPERRKPRFVTWAASRDRVTGNDDD